MQHLPNDHQDIPNGSMFYIKCRHVHDFGYFKIIALVCNCTRTKNLLFGDIVVVETTADHDHVTSIHNLKPNIGNYKFEIVFNRDTNDRAFPYTMRLRGCNRTSQFIIKEISIFK